jgi:hypothetical protein
MVAMHTQGNDRTSKNFGWAAVLLLALTVSISAAAQTETISAVARGTSTQMGKNISINVIINQYSPPQDRQTLIDAYKKGQNQGLVNALSKMKPAGRIQIPGTVGYSLAYITTVPTSTGRKIRFVTNRKIAFGEVARNTQSRAFDLTAGEFDLNDQDSKKSTGALYPATQLTLNSEGTLTWELNQNPWELTGIIDWQANKKKEGK